MRFILVLTTALLTSTVALAQDFQTRVKDFIDSAEWAAENIRPADELITLFETAKDAEGAEQRLRDLEQNVQEAAENYGESSPVWVKHQELLDFVKERQENAVTKFQETGNDRWQAQHARWETNGAALQQLRLDIITEADRAGDLAKQFSGEIELVLDIYLADGVEAAVAELENVKTNLTDLNNNVEGALLAAQEQLTAPATGN